MRGLVIKSTGSWYHVMDIDGNHHEARLRGKFKLKGKKITNPVAVGDWVEIEQLESGESYFIITKLEDRKNYVVRKSPSKTAHAQILASNIDQAMIMATFKMPKTSLGFIDRFLVTTETYRIPTIIIFNKIDLLNDVEQLELKKIKKMYSSIGYKCAAISLLNDQGLDTVKGYLGDSVTLLSGHSGTGKSTMINRLSPHAAQATAEVSGFANKGVHTTTFAEMFANEKGGYIIDTPGIKEFGLMEVGGEELSHYFPEMRKFLGKCKFHNCMHTHEPGCLLIEAVESGEVPQSRYDSYLSMLEDDDNRK